MNAPPTWEHRIRPNDVTWTPKRWLFVDVEGQTVETPEGERDTFRLACATFVVRDGDLDARERREELTARSPRELWEWVTARCHGGHATWLATHGLHYDYQAGAAERELRRLGWRRVDGSMRVGARWERWKLGRRSLTLIDSWNYLGQSIEQAGHTLGLPKRRMPKDDATDRAWERYCRRDVEVLERAMLTLLDWWDAEELGRWTFTAGGLALAAYRHRFMGDVRLVHHVNPQARRLERHALHGGRREILRHGQLPQGWWAELDYVSHYLIIAAAVRLPVELKSYTDHPAQDVLDHVPPAAGIIAEVTVEVPEPLVPFRHPRLGSLYPVGTFRTTLCQPELELVRERGRILKVHRAALYRTAPALESWGDWLLHRVLGATDDVPAVIGPMLKHWTESLIGKFGQRRPQGAPEPHRDVFAGRQEVTVFHGGTVQEMPWVDREPQDPERGQDAYNAVPALTAWVHSAARVQLHRALDLAGRDDVAYLDTDGFVVEARMDNLRRLAQLDPAIRPKAASVQDALPAPERAERWLSTGARRAPSERLRRVLRTEKRIAGGMRVKNLFDSVVVHRPQDYELDGVEVIKGLPRIREKIGDRRYRAMYWPGVDWQRKHTDPGTYIRPVREVQLTEEYLRGWLCDDGRVRPLEVTMEAGRVAVVPWSRTRWAKGGTRLQDRTQGRRITERARAPSPS